MRAVILRLSGFAVLGCQVTPSAAAGEAKPLAVDSEPSKNEPPSRPSDDISAPNAVASAPVTVAVPGARAVAAETAEPPPTCPDEMSFASGVCVDRYEAHLVEVDTAGRERRHPEYERPAPGVAYQARSAAGVRPQAYISQIEARQACEHAGKRLCSLVEWSRSCRGSENATYPYGPEYERGRCNMAQKHILTELHGDDPMTWTYDDFNDPELIKQGALAKAGSFAGCKNDFELFDMVGNLHEWVDDKVDATLPSKAPLPKRIAQTVRRKVGNGVFMGGFFSTGHQHGHGCEFITIAHEPKYHDYSTGFRCCRDPQTTEEVESSGN